MSNQESPVENYGNVMNEVESVEFSSPIPVSEALNIPHFSSAMPGHYTPSSLRSHLHQRVELAMRLASIRGGRA